MRKVEVIPYDSKWPEMFAHEADKIIGIMKENIIKIYHIGSTSIPGMAAKPIIDLLVEVKSLDKVDSYNRAMMRIGYHAKGENGISNRRYFSKGGDKRTHHVHMFEERNSEIKRHLQFRDYLRVHSEKAQEYSNLKQLLAQEFPYDIDQYVKGKNALIKEIESLAEKWNNEIRTE